MHNKKKHAFNYVLAKLARREIGQKESGYVWNQSKRRLARLLTSAPIFAGAIHCSAALAASQKPGEASAAPGFFEPLISSPSFAVYFSTAMISGFAWLTIVAAKNRERKRNTFQMLGESTKDPLLQQAFQVVKELHEHEEEEVKQFANRKRHEEDKAVAIRYMLNHFEYVCIGMKMGVYDEDVLFTSQKTIILGCHSRCEQYIKELRAQTEVPTIYIEIEALAKRWQDKKLKITSANKWQHKCAFWK